MGGLVVGSAFPSYVGESEVGASIDPTNGCFVRHKLDRTHFGPGLGSLRKDLLAFYPFLDDFYPSPLDLVTGRRLYPQNGPQRLVQGQIQRGGAMGYPFAPGSQWNVTSFFGSNPGPSSDVGTVACWVKVNVDDTNLVPVAMIGNGLTEAVFMGFWNGSFTVGAQSTTFGILDILVDTPQAVGVWRHVVWTADDTTGEWKIFVDGVDRALTPVVGANNGYWSSTWNGLGIDLDLTVARQSDLGTNCGFTIHELGVWNRILTQEEINQLYRHPDSVYALTRRVTNLDRYRAVVTGIGSSEAFGSPVELVHTLKPTAIASASAIGLAELVHILKPTAISSLEALGLPELVHVLKPTAIASSEAHGTHELVHVLKFTGVPSASAIGTHELAHVLKFLGIASTEAVPTPELVHVLKAFGVASAEAHGIPELIHVLKPSGIASASAIGLAELVHILKFFGVASAEALGTPALVDEIQYLIIPSIASAETHGLLELVHTIKPVAIACADGPTVYVFVTEIVASVVDNTVQATVVSPQIVASMASAAITATIETAPLSATVDSTPIIATVEGPTINATLDCG